MSDLDDMMKTAYFPGRDLYGEEWWEDAMGDKSKSIIIIERHHDSTKALRTQENFGKKDMVIAVNNFHSYGSRFYFHFRAQSRML